MKLRCMPLFCLLLSPSLLVADIQELFIDKGACPGERCTYCALYVAKRNIVIRKEPRRDGEEAGVISAGDAVLAQNGEVHVRPAKFNVYRDFDQFKAGDEVYLLTYMGEGYFKIRHNGEMSQGEFGFSPWGGSWDGECGDRDQCVGGLDDGYEWTWWVFVHTEKSQYGWIPMDEDSLRSTSPF